MKTLLISLLLLALASAGAVGFAFSGLYDVAATSSHSGVVSWLLSGASHASIERRAQNVNVPVLQDEALVSAGINDFDAMCAGCHGAPGKPRTAVGKGLNPPAPDLAESARHMPPAELFWVTKHGIKMTGMPAWGVTHDDDSLWPVVALMARLPELDEAGYAALLEASSGQGHHAEPHDHGSEPTTNEESPPHGEEPNNDAHEHDDHDHEH